MIDVDAGRLSPDQANRRACAALLRHIPLQHLGGQIVVDFIDSPDQTGWRALEAALATGLGANARIIGVAAFAVMIIRLPSRGLALAQLLQRVRSRDRASS